MGSNPGGFGSNLSHNISQIPQKFSNMYLHMSSKQILIQILQRKFRMGEINNSVDGILHCRRSYAHAGQRYLVLAILFLSDRGKRDSV